MPKNTNTPSDEGSIILKIPTNFLTKIPGVLNSRTKIQIPLAVFFTVLVTNALILNFPIEEIDGARQRSFLGLLISFIFGTFVCLQNQNKSPQLKEDSMKKKGFYVLINSLLIFAFAFGSGNFMNKMVELLPDTQAQSQIISKVSRYSVAHNFDFKINKTSNIIPISHFSDIPKNFNRGDFVPKQTKGDGNGKGIIDTFKKFFGGWK